jgi:hypothetical protein
MSEMNCQAGNDFPDGLRRKARARGARRMVLQGLTLYYQSLVHRVHEETPEFFEDVLQRARDPSGRNAN